MYNFTVGPVMSYKETLEIAGKQTPYFRTSDFSDLMLENERLMLDYLHAPEGSKCAFLTTSGTGAMEASVVGLLSKNDKVGVINGGTFGQRFLELCQMHSIPHIEIKCEFGKQITQEQISICAEKGITALLVNMDETSSGILYDMQMISDFCKKNKVFLIVDAISSFLADPLDMSEMAANVVIVASQKALALQPGLSIVAMDQRALERVHKTIDHSMYLSLRESLENMKRGQTPFTPAVSILLQLNARLKMIEQQGGVIYEIESIQKLALDFRKRIRKYPMKTLIDEEQDRSNAVTAIISEKNKAVQMCEILKNKYDIWVCPNGGVYKNNIFRVGHIGAITTDDYDALFYAFDELVKNDLL